MTLTQLRDSLKYWRAKHTYRQWRLDIAHLRNDKALVNKWHALLVEAGENIRHRETQIAVLTKPTDRERVVAVARKSKANYDKNPGAYHYLAGGIPNTVILSPTPWSYRSDCSQFAVGCYRLAGVKCPGTGTYLYSNTASIAAGGRFTLNPQPGDLGMYGSRRAPHHVEVVVGVHPLRFVGHGTRPIDGVTPGLPTYYLSFLD